uniref:Uncharacterized protein n=1 Tax=Haptolina ericina TaxID=156174 RepID=A0A7S3ANI5_9EUKA
MGEGQGNGHRGWTAVARDVSRSFHLVMVTPGLFFLSTAHAGVACCMLRVVCCMLRRACCMLRRAQVVRDVGVLDPSAWDLPDKRVHTADGMRVGGGCAHACTVRQPSITVSRHLSSLVCECVLVCACVRVYD